MAGACKKKDKRSKNVKKEKMEKKVEEDVESLHLDDDL